MHTRLAAVVAMAIVTARVGPLQLKTVKTIPIPVVGNAMALAPVAVAATAPIIVKAAATAVVAEIAKEMAAIRAARDLRAAAMIVAGFRKAPQGRPQQPSF
ncbi:MAG: hypothetical protein PHY92_00810 [Alphaproteobacteria bacterium]|nr:hypothetical protein [Alphaproteobacteria bacterium]